MSPVIFIPLDEIDGVCTLLSCNSYNTLDQMGAHFPPVYVQVCWETDNFRNGHQAFTWKRGNVHFMLALLVNFNNTKEN